MPHFKGAFDRCGVNVEMVESAERRVDWCNACGLCKDTVKCPIDDHVDFMLDKIVEADAVMFSVPR